MTRRLLKKQPPSEFPNLIKMNDDSGWFWFSSLGSGKRTWPCGYEIVPDEPCGRIVGKLFTPPFAIGDTMWVRESWLDDGTGEPGNIHYRGAANDADLKWIQEEGWKWRHAMFMPKMFCRTQRVIKEVRIERLQDIKNTPDEIQREGITYCLPAGDLFEHIPLLCFKELWDSINKKPGTRWEDNPWVAVYGWENP